jgi:methionyl-tRNA formyltransferase
LQRAGIEIDSTDTAGSLYFRKLYPLGIDVMLEAVARIDRREARFELQDEARATFQGLVDDVVARVDFARPAVEIDRLVRGCDPQPGAWARCGLETIRLFDARRVPETTNAQPGTIVRVDDEGMLLALTGGALRVSRVRIGESKKALPGELGLVAGQRLDSAPN